MTSLASRAECGSCPQELTICLDRQVNPWTLPNWGMSEIPNVLFFKASLRDVSSRSWLHSLTSLSDKRFKLKTVNFLKVILKATTSDIIQFFLEIVL